MEWHQEAMAQLIEDFLLGKFSGRGPPKNEEIECMVLYGFIWVYTVLYDVLWCCMVFTNDEIGMSEWDILPPGNDTWRETLRTKWGFNLNRKIIKVNGGLSSKPRLTGAMTIQRIKAKGMWATSRNEACLMFSNFFSQQVSGFFLPNDSCHLANKIVMARNGREK